jgi:hypothetical protein
MRDPRHVKNLLLSTLSLFLLSGAFGCGGGSSTPPPPPPPPALVATHFSVTSVAAATAGTAINFAVTALDASNNTATAYTGTVQFSSSDAQAVLPASSMLTNGAGNFPVTLKTAGSQTITATDTVSAITGTSKSINVSSGPASHFSVVAPGTAAPGTAFNFTVTALDAFSNVATGYSGTAHFTSTDGKAVLPANSALVNGTGSYPATLNTVSNETITATDTVTPAINGTSNSIAVEVAVAGGQFESTGSMETPRYLHTAALLSNGEVLIAGGLSVPTSPPSPLDTAELFNPASASFTPTGNMTTGRANHKATLLADGSVLITGGGFVDTGVLATAELFNQSTGIFTPTGSMQTARVDDTATLLSNGKVLIAGGNDGTEDVATAELYDPSTGIFTPTGNMTTAREGHTATLLSNGTVLIAGGNGATGDLVTAELFDPATAIFTPTGSLLSVQRFHTATLLNDGTVLLTGGDYSVVVLYDSQECRPRLESSRSAELYDPSSGMFAYTSYMVQSRALHTATLLTNGEVLVTGGDQLMVSYSNTGCPQGSSLVLPTAELYQ